MEVAERRGEVSEMKKEMEEMMTNEEEQLERLEEEKDTVVRKMEELEKTNHLLSQKIRGLKSGMACREKLRTSKVITFKEEPSSSLKSVMTAIHGIIEKDVVVVNNDDHRTQCFHGKQSKHTISSDAEFAEHKMACSQTSMKEVQKRAKFIDDVALPVSSPVPNIDEKQLLYTELIRVNKETLQKFLKSAGFSLMERLTPTQAINIQSLLHLPTNKVRNLRLCLSKYKHKHISIRKSDAKGKSTPCLSHK